VRLPQQRAQDVPFVVELRDGRPGVTAIKATSVYTATHERQADVAVALPPNSDNGSARCDAFQTAPEMVARWLRDSARLLRHYPWKHPRRNRQRRRLRYANPINAASKSDTPRVSGDQSGAREGQSPAGADTEERLNTCNRRLFTRA
jgi:hypothetical protein